MFGEKEKCCCCPPRESEVAIHIKYVTRLNELEAKLDKAERTIADLAETNKHLSRAVRPGNTSNNRDAKE